jgi:hypothetical protein
VTGTSTLRPMRHGRSCRNQRDTLAGSVDTITSSKPCVSTRRAIARRGVGFEGQLPRRSHTEGTQPVEAELQLLLCNSAIVRRCHDSTWRAMSAAVPPTATADATGLGTGTTRMDVAHGSALTPRSRSGWPVRHRPASGSRRSTRCSSRPPSAMWLPEHDSRSRADAPPASPWCDAPGTVERHAARPTSYLTRRRHSRSCDRLGVQARGDVQGRGRAYPFSGALGPTGQPRRARSLRPTRHGARRRRRRLVCGRSAPRAEGEP